MKTKVIKAISILLISGIVFSCTACGKSKNNEPDDNTPTETVSNEVDFEAHGNLLEEKTSGEMIKVVSSTNELNAFIDDSKSQVDFTPLLTALDKYNDAYFEDQSLLILWKNVGFPDSVEVDKVERIVHSDDSVQYTVDITCTTYTVQAHPAIPVAYCLLIELNKDADLIENNITANWKSVENIN